MGHPLEGRSQRLRHHLRRTHQPVEQLRRRTALTPFVGHSPASLFAEPKAGRWWLAARRGEITAHSNRQDPPDAYAVSITVAPPVHWRGNLSNLIKPLADGLVSALHSHMGHVDHVLERASAIDPALTREEMDELLTRSRTAPLGTVRLAVPWGATVQWLPADDRIVALHVRIAPTAPAGSVEAHAHLVEPAPNGARQQSRSSKQS